MNRAQQLLEEVFEARRKKPVPAQPAAPEPAPLMNPKEMEDFALTALGWGDVIRLRGYAERGLYVSGKLTRRDHRYVHENTVSFDLEVCDMDSFTDEEQAEIEKAANEVEERVQKEVRTTSKKIYRALEKEWDWRLSDETIDEDIRANEYEFDAEGNREEGTGIEFDQLDDHAKEKAREWMRQGHYEDPDTWWADHIIDEWKEELDKMGFPDADLYQSTLEAMRLVYPRLSPGGIMLFHDWDTPHLPGVPAAIKEFMSDKPERLVVPRRFDGAAGQQVYIVREQWQ